MPKPLYKIRSQPVSGGEIELHWQARDLARAKRLAQAVADRLGSSHTVWIDGEIKSTTTTTTRVDWKPDALH